MLYTFIPISTLNDILKRYNVAAGNVHIRQVKQPERECLWMETMASESIKTEIYSDRYTNNTHNW